MYRFLARTTVALLLGVLVFSVAACSCTPEEEPSGERQEDSRPSTSSADATQPASNGASQTTESPAAQPDSSAAPVVPAPVKPAPAPSVELGPTDATVSWAYLKDMYEKNGTWYVVVDYLQVVGPEESLKFLNENPRLRTFPLSNSTKLLLLKGSGGPDYKTVSVAEFASFEARSGDEVVEITPKSGYAYQLKEWWAP